MSKATFAFAFAVAVIAFVSVRLLTGPTSSGEAPLGPSAPVRAEGPTVDYASEQAERRSAAVGSPNTDEDRSEPPVIHAPLPELTLEEQEEQFKWLRAATELSELEREAAQLQQELVSEYKYEVDARLASGEYDIVSKAKEGVAEVGLADMRPDVVQFFTTNSEGEVVRVTLPEGRYPEAYDNYRKQTWLAELIAQKKKARFGPR